MATAQQLETPADRRHLPRAARHDRPRLAVGAQLHPAHLRADARDALDRRGQARDARRAHRARTKSASSATPSTRWPTPRRAAGRHPEAGTAGDVRPHRRRPGARPLAPDPEHRQQLQADPQDVGGRRVPRHVPPHGRARDAGGQARARGPAEHRQADPARALPDRAEPHRSASRSSRCSRWRKPPASRCSAELAPEPLYVEGDCSRSAASIATWWSTRSRRPRRAASSSPRSKRTAIACRCASTTPAAASRADRLQAVFEDFVTTKRRGLGLGLAITRKIVEQLGGRICVASEVGKGTTFVIDFPRTQRAADGAGGGLTGSRVQGRFSRG